MYVNPLQERAILNNKDHVSLCRKCISFSVENLHYSIIITILSNYNFCIIKRWVFLGVKICISLSWTVVLRC